MPVRAYDTDHLLPEQRGEVAVADQQLAGRPVLDDPAVPQHDRAVGQLEGRQPLGRDQHRAALAAPAAAASTSSCSVCVSTADSGSSITITRAPAISARASATRWRWPPDRFTPRSPISVS